MFAWLLLTALLQQPAAPAPDTSTNVGTVVSTYRSIKNFVLRSAEKMPPEHFAFAPSPDVRPFGQVLAHIVDANYLLCSPPLGEPSPNGSEMQKTENAKLDRAPMLERLKESFAWCDRAYDMLTEGNAGDTLALMNTKRPRLGVLWFHISHAFEHYGNLVTYMRIKGIVPPSSEGR